MHRKMIVSVVVLCALLALPLTSDTSNAAISAGKNIPAAAPGPAPTDGIETPDDRFAAVARQVPGFGGIFFDQDGTLQVYMEGHRGPANEALTAFLEDVITREIGRGERLSHKGIEILEGKYSFLDLHRWQQQMSPDVLAIPGVVFADIAEDENRLRIGITDSPGMAEAVEKSLSKLGVPREAVLISETKEVFPELQNRRRPLRGGLQIGIGGFVCTLGFVAVRLGRTGFVTNSHCTGVQGGSEGTVFHQPIPAAFNANNVGVEIADPTYFTGGSCPAGMRCRYSDSAFVATNSLTSTSRGTIARTPGPVAWNGVDTFTITAEAAPIFGQALTKVGRTTGRTSGSVTQTCTHFNVANTNITQLCQYRATYSSAGGDSGSPVFLITALPNVTLVGIHWGGGGVFSPITGIQMSGELGSITTCASGGC